MIPMSTLSGRALSVDPEFINLADEYRGHFHRK